MNSCQTLNKTRADIVMDRVARKVMEKSLADSVSLGGDWAGVGFSPGWQNEAVHQTEGSEFSVITLN